MEARTYYYLQHHLSLKNLCLIVECTSLYNFKIYLLLFSASRKSEEPEMPRLTSEEKAAIKEQFKQQKLAEKMALKEEIKKKRQEEMQKKKEERALVN